MKKYPLISVILILALAQVAVVSRIKILGSSGDCFTIALVYAGLFFNIRTVIVSGIFVGALKDVFSANPSAFNTILAPAWGFLVFQAARRLTVDSNPIRCVLVFFIAFCNAAVLRTVWWFQGISVPLGVSVRIMAADSLLTAVLALGIFKILKVR